MGPKRLKPNSPQCNALPWLGKASWGKGNSRIQFLAPRWPGDKDRRRIKSSQHQRDVLFASSLPVLGVRHPPPRREYPHQFSNAVPTSALAFDVIPVDALRSPLNSTPSPQPPRGYLHTGTSSLSGTRVPGPSPPLSKKAQCKASPDTRNQQHLQFFI